MFKTTPYAQAFLKKQAFVPYTKEAMDAAQQPPPEQGAPMPPPEQGAPQDPNAAPSQGGAPIQTQPGPNGEPIDVETGFIVVDMENGIEQDPLTGILYNKFEDSFATPEGQPLDPRALEGSSEGGSPRGGSARRGRSRGGDAGRGRSRRGSSRRGSVRRGEDGGVILRAAPPRKA